MLEIKSHDGPARQGKYQATKTPNILQITQESVVPDEPMPYDVPREMAKWSVENTIENAQKGDVDQIAVLHGAKYPDLRLECASALEELGYRLFLVANTDDLLRKPQDLLKIITSLRENMSPNSALFFPFAELNFIPLLVYLGVDLFGDSSADFYAKIGVMTTPHGNYDLQQYPIYDFTPEELKKYNRDSLDFVLREVRAHIQNGTLRNLVEERCCSSPEAMSALRILDRDYGDFLDGYTQLY
ncbi:queuine/other tRNA-ribosyltransferase [Methanobacterium formicicum]|uniref:Queuine/other tRNA-ribosyltransferase n=1 Tax=Methanobacterium formicicum (strain DSM 3637 / PP1) TaxID=1204725 RepID=K2QDG6_METFP|nr:queuine/other tRNA-ribosyltransferase [Methanobacterium formicicum]EKF86076.1 queuine/other tRNA-ribosyltransferase [Methanobacterium formicicum DSM 3637]